MPDKYDHLAPDTSEIRILAYMKDDELHLPPDDHEVRVPLLRKGGVLVHCILPPRKTSNPIMHDKIVQEAWFCLQGTGQFWRKQGDIEKIVDVKPGTTLTIPTKTRFQFRNTSDDNPLIFLICTLPFWPSSQEAIPVEGKWH